MSGIAPAGSGSDRKTWDRAARNAVAAAVSLLCLATVPTGAAQARSDGPPNDEIVLAGALPDSELDTYRGGFEVGGFMIAGFGAKVRTLFEGKELVSLINFGDQIRGSITTTIKDLATGQQVVVSGADQNSKVIQAITANTKVTYDFNKGILTTVQNSANNATVNSSVTMTMGIQNYQSMMRAAQTRSTLHNIASQVRNSNLRR